MWTSCDVSALGCRLENPPEAGILPEATVASLEGEYEASNAERRASAAAASPSSSPPALHAAHGGVLYPPYERSQIRESWKHLMRWSRAWRTGDNGNHFLEKVEKVISGWDAQVAIEFMTLLHDQRGPQAVVCPAGCSVWRGLLRDGNGMRVGTAKATSDCDTAVTRPICLQRHQ